jgi:hypothetical protein
VEAVLNSKVGVTITGFITKLQIKAKKQGRMSQNENSDKGKFRHVNYSNYVFPTNVSE